MRKKSVPIHIYTNKIQTLKTPCTSVLSALTIQSRRMQHSYSFPYDQLTYKIYFMS